MENYKNKISLVVPVYNEEENIGKFLEDVKKIDYYDEIIVVDNNSSDNSKEIIKATNVTYLHEDIQGYGAALYKGMINCKNDIICTIEPDGSFDPSEIERFLPYLDSHDCVFGTRTNSKYIKFNAKMGLFLRFGNIAVAKLLGILFNYYYLTDVGCTFKVFKKEYVDRIKNDLDKIKDSTFQPYLMILLISEKIRIIEIPVSYYPRIGYSKITYDFTSSFILGLRMILLIIKIFFKKLLNKKNA
ncbi:glycosyltransferase family 2 protein [Candidatus Pelagibacter ubique]|nr:glycosyltransferase family 2 protein [Candidatus Pelagibacter ubique]